MPAKKYLQAVGGISGEKAGTVVSAGAANGGDIVALNDSGVVDPSILPPGVTANSSTLPASEALAAGAFVNVWSNAGAASVRNANASVVGKEAHGFVLAAVASGANATVYFNGRNTAVSGQTPGVAYLSAATAGASQSTDPAPSGGITQRLGFAVGATEVNFEPSPPIGRA